MPCLASRTNLHLQSIIVRKNLMSFHHSIINKWVNCNKIHAIASAMVVSHFMNFSTMLMKSH